MTYRNCSVLYSLQHCELNFCNLQTDHSGTLIDLHTLLTRAVQPRRTIVWCNPKADANLLELSEKLRPTKWKCPTCLKFVTFPRVLVTCLLQNPITALPANRLLICLHLTLCLWVRVLTVGRPGVTTVAMKPWLPLTMVTRLTQWLVLIVALTRRGVTHPLPDAPNKLPRWLATQRRPLITPLVLLAWN